MKEKQNKKADLLVLHCATSSFFISKGISGGGVRRAWMGYMDKNF